MMVMLLLFLLLDMEYVSELLIQNETRDGFSCWLVGWIEWKLKMVVVVDWR